MVVEIAKPYSQLAEDYDATMGVPFFLQARNTFEKLARRYGITFRTAADIGCGTGLFARHLKTSRGIPVFAVDLSEPMLRVAARNCCGTDVLLLRQDIRRLNLPWKVDLITANFDTLNHIIESDDLRRTLRRVFESLNSGGHFIFDLVTDCPPLRRGSYVRHFRNRYRRIKQAVRIDPFSKLLSIFVSISSPHRWRPVIERHCERAYSPGELGRALYEAGFAIRGMHDAATSELASGCPPRIIVIARKKGGRQLSDTSLN